jgi:hypothetical protein
MRRYCKMHLTEMGFDDMDCIYLAKDMDYLLTTADTVMNIRV